MARSICSKGIVVSCNAYFAQLGTYKVGADALHATADLFGIAVANPNTPKKLKDALPQAAYGQGQVVRESFPDGPRGGDDRQ